MLDVSVGDLVSVRFLDHCTAHGENTDPCEFVVYGCVSKVSDTHIVVMSWCNLDVEDLHNEEGYTILTSCILGIQHMLAVDEVWDWSSDDSQDDEGFEL